MKNYQDEMMNDQLIISTPGTSHGSSTSHGTSTSTSHSTSTSTSHSTSHRSTMNTTMDTTINTTMDTTMDTTINATMDTTMDTTINTTMDTTINTTSSNHRTYTNDINPTTTDALENAIIDQDNIRINNDHKTVNHDDVAVDDVAVDDVAVDDVKVDDVAVDDVKEDDVAVDDGVDNDQTFSSIINDYLELNLQSNHLNRNDLYLNEDENLINYRNEPFLMNLLQESSNYNFINQNHCENTTTTSNDNHLFSSNQSDLFSTNDSFFNFTHIDLDQHICKKCNQTHCTCARKSKSIPVSHCSQCNAPKGVQWYNKELPNGSFIKICRPCWAKERRLKVKPTCVACKTILVGKTQISAGFCFLCMPKPVFLVAGSNTTKSDSPLDQSLNHDQASKSSNGQAHSKNTDLIVNTEDSGLTAVATADHQSYITSPDSKTSLHINPSNIISDNISQTKIAESVISSNTASSEASLEKPSSSADTKSSVSHRSGKYKKKGSMGLTRGKKPKQEELRTCNNCHFAGSSSSTKHQWYKDNSHKNLDKSQSNLALPIAYLCNTCYSRNIRMMKQKRKKHLSVSNRDHQDSINSLDSLLILPKDHPGSDSTMDSMVIVGTSLPSTSPS